MSKTPKGAVPGLTDALRDTISLRAAHPTGGKPGTTPINIGGGPKIIAKPDKPEPDQTPPVRDKTPSK
jgi:hypothetical protein